MSAVMLATALTAAAKPSPSSKAAMPGDTFAGVLNTVSGRPDPSTRRKPTASLLGAAGDDAEAEASPEHADQTPSAATLPGTVDVTLLVQAALSAAPASAASITTPAKRGGAAGSANAPTAPVTASRSGPDTTPQSTAGSTTGSPPAATAHAAAADGTVDQPSVPQRASTAEAAILPTTASGAKVDDANTHAADPYPDAPSAAGQAPIAGPRTTAGASRAQSAVEASDPETIPAADDGTPGAPGSPDVGLPPPDNRGQPRGNEIGVATRAAAASTALASSQALDQPAPAAPMPSGGSNPTVRNTGSASSAAPLRSAAWPVIGDSAAGGPSPKSGGTPGSNRDGKEATSGRDRAVASTRSDPTVSKAAVTAATSAITEPQPTALPVVQQVATALKSLADPTATASGLPVSSAGAAPVATPVAPSAGAGVKSLTVELDPGHLGPVSITLRLTGDTVGVHIAVAKPETLHMLERDRHILAAAVTALGAAPESLQLGRETTAISTAASPTSSLDVAGRQASLSDGSTTGRQAQNTGRHADRADPETDHDDATAVLARATGRTDGSLYL